MCLRVLIGFRSDLEKAEKALIGLFGALEKSAFFLPRKAWVTVKAAPMKT